MTEELSNLKMFFNLPNEILSRIIKFLPFKDLKSMCLVCSKFQVLSEHPSLWSNLPLILCANLRPVLTLSRLSSLSQLHLVDLPLTDTDLTYLQQAPLTCLCLDKCDFSGLSAQLLYWPPVCPSCWFSNSRCTLSTSKKKGLVMSSSL